MAGRDQFWLGTGRLDTHGVTGRCHASARRSSEPHDGFCPVAEWSTLLRNFNSMRGEKATFEVEIAVV